MDVIAFGAGYAVAVFASRASSWPRRPHDLKAFMTDFRKAFPNLNF